MKDENIAKCWESLLHHIWSYVLYAFCMLFIRVIFDYFNANNVDTLIFMGVFNIFFLMIRDLFYFIYKKNKNEYSKIAEIPLHPNCGHLWTNYNNFKTFGRKLQSRKEENNINYKETKINHPNFIDTCKTYNYSGWVKYLCEKYNYMKYIARIETDCEPNIDRVYIIYKNKYILSVVQGYSTYGGVYGLFEIALVRDCEFCTEKLGFHDDDVIGYLSMDEVEKYIEKAKDI